MGKRRRIPPTHPGEVLLEEYMKPYALSANALATDLGLPATRIGDIIHERRGITAETAIALSEYFKTSAEFWLGFKCSTIKRPPKMKSASGLDRAFVTGSWSADRSAFGSRLMQPVHDFARFGGFSRFIICRLMCKS
jgi:addiction module HigA family antidote